MGERGRHEARGLGERGGRVASGLGVRARHELRDFDERGVRLTVAQPCTAHQLLLDLLGSKAVVQRAFARHQLLCEGEPLLPTSALAAGQAVELRFYRHEERGAAPATGCPTAGPPAPGPQPTVLFCDPILMAVDKPAGILVHGDGTGAATLTAQVQALRAAEGQPTQVQAVQRLDVQTTGVVLFSLTEEFQPALDAQMAGHDMRKRYLAVVEGRLVASERGWLELTGPLGRDRHDQRRMRVSPSGKPALTRVRTIERRQGKALLLVELGTGRKHQIRVHLAHAGHPILGDDLYGGRPHPAGLMLHAWEETLVHPVTGETLRLATPVPVRFASLFPTALERLAQER